MLADLSYAQKLWSRGVDISVGVITSVIVGSIGLAFWRVKLWLDLRSAAAHQRQEHRIAEELAQGEKRRQIRELREQIAATVKLHAQQAYAAPNSVGLAEIWNKHVEWLMREKLNLLSANAEILGERAAWAPAIQRSLNLHELRQEVVEVIRRTELPPE